MLCQSVYCYSMNVVNSYKVSWRAFHKMKDINMHGKQNNIYSILPENVWFSLTL